MADEQKILSRSVGTHDGTFHADEVTACALLIIFDKVDPELIFRNRDSAVLDKCEYVCDVGGIYDPGAKRFDHHQVDYEGELSSAGMVLRYLRDQGKLEEATFQHLKKTLVDGVDAHDNGRVPADIGQATFSHVVANFNPTRHSVGRKGRDEAFKKALEFVKGHLERVLDRLSYHQDCRSVVEEAMKEQGPCLRFKESLPWLENFFELGGKDHPAVFVIMPSGEHWKLRGIPPTYEDRMSVRVALPEEWAGLLEGDLKDVSGIPGGIFCHKGRFISVWETEEDAVKALQYVLK